MIRVLVVTPDPSDPTSFYRAVGPFLSLEKAGHVIAMVTDKPSWVSYKAADIVFVQRPHLPEYLEVVDTAKRLGRPVWVDFDDLLIDIPDSNPRAHVYRDPGVLNAMRQSISKADILTVSTEVLKEELSHLQKNIEVVPNAFDSEMFGARPAIRSTGRPIILWRGSSTHDEDLLLVADEIGSLVDEIDAEWHFLGSPHWGITRIVQQKRPCFVHPWKDLLAYFRKLGDIQPTVQIVPLVDSPFNRAKSNIAWIEGSWAGAVIVAPSFPEWHQPGVHNYDADRSFSYAVRCALTNASGANAYSWGKVQEKYLLDKVNEKRLAILQRYAKV